ncbi:MAG TPA: futalosine hydrolase [Desulfobacterales bacterium]|nr:futalosine hydrolase [Desulfobacterales bacterium]
MTAPILLVCATEFERAFLPADTPGQVLVTGVGPVDTALALGAFLAKSAAPPSLLLDFGVAGAYPGGGAEVLDLCLAQREFFGDLGVCSADRIEPLDEDEATAAVEEPLDASLVNRACQILADRGLSPRRGNFVTVACVSGSRRRGLILARRFDAMCENMEGAAVARAGRRFAVPVLELRVVSNLVEDRDRTRWRLKEAARQAGHAAGLLVAALSIAAR